MKQSTLQHDLQARGLIAQAGGGELADILSQKRAMYVGVDPTADSMHAGNLVPIILMKHLADAGHTPVLLVGGGTGMIGDPKASGERVLLDAATLAKNQASIKRQLSGLLKVKNLKVVNNADWLSKVGLIDFLRDIGKHFTVNALIKRDIIKRRLETEEDSISYTEFSYSLLQGYDFLHLFKKHKVDLQIGGSDQWANIISGVDLIRRKENGTAFALTTPIVVDKTSGKKFGKSEGNAVWLDPKKTSPFAFYQFWINTTDENVGDYLKIFSFSPLAKIEKVLAEHQKAPHKRLAQRQLASDVTAFIHGAATAKTLERISDTIYGGKATKLSASELKLMAAEVPSKKLSTKERAVGINIVDFLIAVGLTESKSEAKRLIEGNGVSVNGKPAKLDTLINAATIKSDHALVRRGKKVALVY